MSLAGIPQEIKDRYRVEERKHGASILKADFPNEFEDIIRVLSEFHVLRSHIVVGGGGKTKVAQSIDAAFKARGWVEKSWDTKIVVDEVETKSPTHKVDCYKNRVALELEWSNKDPFYDRDLNNFRLLFDLRVISVGVIVTKDDNFREVFDELNIFSKYGMSTTWMSKLMPKIEGGGGGGCPLLVFGITKSCYTAD